MSFQSLQNAAVKAREQFDRRHTDVQELRRIEAQFDTAILKVAEEAAKYVSWLDYHMAIKIINTHPIHNFLKRDDIWRAALIEAVRINDVDAVKAILPLRQWVTGDWFRPSISLLNQEMIPLFVGRFDDSELGYLALEYYRKTKSIEWFGWIVRHMRDGFMTSSFVRHLFDKELVIVAVLHFNRIETTNYERAEMATYLHKNNLDDLIDA